MKLIKTLLERKKIAFCLALFWTITVLYLCLIDSSNLPSLGINTIGVDKMVHLLFHFIYIFLWALFFLAYQKRVSNRLLIKILMSSILLGLTIEWLQSSFTLTRQADILDVVANTIGALLATILFRLRFKDTR